MNDDETNRRLEIIKKHVAQLAGHFDSVEIFVTEYISPEKGTFARSFGTGNWFARYGQIKDWLNQQDIDTEIDLRNQRNEEDE